MNNVIILKLWYNNIKNDINNNTLGGSKMKLLCKCGNVEDIKTDTLIETFKFKIIDDGSLILVCKKCNEVVFIKSKNC